MAAAGRVIANHFSHNGRCLHSDLEAALSPAGIEVGYDGMLVAIGFSLLGAWLLPRLRKQKKS